jgi:hypothetical protein
MNERNQRQCIVLLPSGPYYDRLFDEILESAIIETGLAPSRIHRSSLSPTPVNIFVDGIDKAEAFFADVSENTAEIWFGVGCAVAVGKPLCLISSKLDSSLPLGIQYLPLIPYPTDALPSDYVRLQQNITGQLSALLPKLESMEPEPELETHVPFLPSPTAAELSEDLASYEVMALTIIDLKAVGAGLSPRDLGLEMQTRGSAHLTSHAMNALKRRRFIERRPVQITQGNELHISENLFLTRAGQEWLLRHNRRSATHRSTTRPRELSQNKR